MSLRRKILRNSFKQKFNIRKDIAWKMRRYKKYKHADD